MIEANDDDGVDVAGGRLDDDDDDDGVDDVGLEPLALGLFEDDDVDDP